MTRRTPMLTAHEVAELLRVHDITVYRFIANGILHPLRIGRIWRFDRAEINQLLSSKRRPPARPETIPAEHAK